MELRNFGSTDLTMPVLGFGCGTVGGLMVRAEHKEMLKSVEYAIDSGINYFDSARMYGDGLSEIHVGAILRELGVSDALVGTKVRLSGSEFNNIEATVSTQIENSLRRLGSETVDIVYTHNTVGKERKIDDGQVSVEDLEHVVIAFEKAVKSGKIRYWGFNGLGETNAIKSAVNLYSPSGIHTCYNMLNPTSGYSVNNTFPYQNYHELITECTKKGIGTVGIRILAGGALSGSTNRHPLALQDVAPIATGDTYQEDVDRTAAYKFLISESFVDNLVEASIRFAISNTNLSTALIGLSNFDQFQKAVDFANKGPLPAEALDKIIKLCSAA